MIINLKVTNLWILILVIQKIIFQLNFGLEMPSTNTIQREDFTLAMKRQILKTRCIEGKVIQRISGCH